MTGADVADSIPAPPEDMDYYAKNTTSEPDQCNGRAAGHRIISKLKPAMVNPFVVASEDRRLCAQPRER